ncbi:phage tail tape measure protein [Streptomyces sp. NPDC006458]|uniref:phage tail tape measure protein n=1 Tax=Streptomyces sp. NPDC006458 TaxID=3154302 RepID=UPI0033B43AC7
MAGDSRTLRVVVVGNARSAEQSLDRLGDSADGARRDVEHLGDALNDAGDNTTSLGDGAGEAGGRLGAMSDMLPGLRDGLLGLGAAIVAALPLAAIVGFEKGLERIGEKAKLSAQLGVTGPEAERAGKLAGDLYAAGWGESFAAAGEAVKRVTQDIQIDLNSADFKPIASKVMALSDTFDLELGGTTRAVSQMLRTGLAKDADEALDIIAAGMTNGVDKSEDFLDTLNEYGTQFRKLGLDGTTATGLLSQGLKGGARDADLVADAFKEFSLRAIDGSTASADGYKLLGLEADKLTAQIAKGGPEASKGLQTVLDRLKSIEDPVKRNAAGVALFGTQFEDLGDAIYALDPKTAVKGLGDVKGAAQEMADTMSNNAAHKVEAFKRRIGNAFTEGFASLITSAQGIGGQLSGALSGAGSALEPVLAPIRQGISGLLDAVRPALSDFASFFRGTVVPLFRELWTQAQPVLAQLGTSIGTWLGYAKTIFEGFVSGVKFLWGIFGGFIISTIKNVFDGAMQFISGALQTIEGIFQIFSGIFTGDWSKAWEGVKNAFGGIWKMIVGAFKVYIYGSIVGILRGGVVRLAALWKGGLNGIKAFFVGIWNGIRAFFSGKIRQLTVAASNGASGIKQFFITHFQSLASGVRDKITVLYGYIKAIPGRVKGFFKDLPGALKQIGLNIIEGLINGIRSSWHKVTAVVDGLVDKIPGPIRSALGIHSPSRVMADIGKWITAGLVKGMLGGSKSVEATSKKLHELVTKAFKVGKISKGKSNSLHAYISNQNKTLFRLSKDREKIQKAISAANLKLADLKKAKLEISSSVAGKAKDYGSFMSAFDSSEFGDNSASAIVARLKSKLQGIIDFRRNLQTLAKRGLGRGIINQIAQAGPEEGGQMAQALLNAGGTEIKQLNSTYSAINTESSKLGSFVASNYYDAGIQSVNGLLRGLKAQEKTLTKQIENLAEAMVKALKKKLGIHSPSRIFKRLGGFTADGYALGVRGGADGVQAAVDELAAIRPSAGSVAGPAVRAASRSSYLSAGVRDVIVNVGGNVTSERDLAKAIATTVRDELVRNGKRNGGRIF